MQDRLALSPAGRRGGSGLTRYGSGDNRPSKQGTPGSSHLSHPSRTTSLPAELDCRTQPTASTVTGTGGHVPSAAIRPVTPLPGSSVSPSMDDDIESIDNRLFEDARAALLRLERPDEREAAIRMLSIWGQEALADGRGEQAVACFRVLAEYTTGSEGPTSDAAMVWRGFLGRALTEMHLYAEAEAVLGDLLVDRERELGRAHPLTLVTRGNLARAVALEGRVDEGLLMARRLLDDRLRLLGPDHPSTLDSRGHIAHFTLLAGRPTEAAALYERLLEDRVRILEPDDPVIEQTRYNLEVACKRAP